MNIKTKALSGIGLLIALGGWVRYTFVWNDTSQSIASILLGSIMVMIAFLYEKQLKTNNRIEQLDNKLDDLQYYVQEKTK